MSDNCINCARVEASEHIRRRKKKADKNSDFHILYPSFRAHIPDRLLLWDGNNAITLLHNPNRVGNDKRSDYHFTSLETFSVLY